MLKLLTNRKTPNFLIFLVRSSVVKNLLNFLHIRRPKNEEDLETVQVHTFALRKAIEEFARAHIDGSTHETKATLLAQLDDQFETAVRLNCKDKETMRQLHTAVHRAHTFLGGRNPERASLLWFASQDTAHIFIDSFDSLFHTRFNLAEKQFEPFSLEDQKYISNLITMHKALLTCDEKNRNNFTKLEAGFRKLISLYDNSCHLLLTHPNYDSTFKQYLTEIQQLKTELMGIRILKTLKNSSLAETGEEALAEYLRIISEMETALQEELAV